MTRTRTSLLGDAAEGGGGRAVVLSCQATYLVSSPGGKSRQDASVFQWEFDGGCLDMLGVGMSMYPRLSPRARQQGPLDNAHRHRSHDTLANLDLGLPLRGASPARSNVSAVRNTGSKQAVEAVSAVRRARRSSSNVGARKPPRKQASQLALTGHALCGVGGTGWEPIKARIICSRRGWLKWGPVSNAQLRRPCRVVQTQLLLARWLARQR